MITHSGGCHCGRVRFEVDAPAELPIDECNCSMCARSAYLHLIVTADRFRITRGQDALLIDVASNEPTVGAVVAVDLSSFELPVLVAAEHELAAHEALLVQLDKSSNGRTLFRKIGENAVA